MPQRRGLSAANLAFLRQVGSAEDGRPCWLYRQPRNRWQLVEWSDGCLREAPYCKNGSTLAQMEAMGLIEYGPDTYLPAPFNEGFGSTVILTAAGRRTLGAAGVAL